MWLGTFHFLLSRDQRIHHTTAIPSIETLSDGDGPPPPLAVPARFLMGIIHLVIIYLVLFVLQLFPDLFLIRSAYIAVSFRGGSVPCIEHPRAADRGVADLVFPIALVEVARGRFNDVLKMNRGTLLME